jgi:hypothetical protein
MESKYGVAFPGGYHEFLVLAEWIFRPLLSDTWVSWYPCQFARAPRRSTILEADSRDV